MSGSKSGIAADSTLTVPGMSEQPAVRRNWGDLLTGSAVWQIVIVAGLLVALYWHELHRLVLIWSRDGDWSHGWLVPVFSLYFIISHRRELLRCRIKPNYFGLVILLMALALYFASIWPLKTGYPKSLSLVMAIFGVVWLLAGTDVIKIAWFPIIFLFFALPIPERISVSMTMPLRMIASSVSAVLLSLYPDLEAQSSGVVIDYLYGGEDGMLNIERACSGMRLMMAFVTLGVAMAYVTDRPWWHRFIMVLACVPIAIVCNIIRVTSTGFFQVFQWRDLAKGTAHELLGLAMLPLALCVFALIGYVLQNLFMEVSDDQPEVEPSSETGESS